MMTIDAYDTTSFFVTTQGDGFFIPIYNSADSTIRPSVFSRRIFLS